jgi:hypothetical protein
MALSTAELERARKALAEIESYRKSRRFWFVQMGAIILYSGMVLLDQPFRWAPYAVAVSIIALGFFSWHQYMGWKNRYPANLDLLQTRTALARGSVPERQGLARRERPSIDDSRVGLEPRSLPRSGPSR